MLQLLLASATLHAQQVRISASLDSTNYLIGDWIQVHISVQHPFNTEILWGNPVLVDAGKLQKISESKVDTIAQRDFLSENKTFTLTTFDTGLIHIPSFTCYYRQDERTDSVATAIQTILVSAVPIDTGKSFHPIKPVLTIAEKKSRTWLYAIGGTTLVFIALLFWYYQKKGKKKAGAVEQTITDTRLPHEKALDDLYALENDLTEKNDVKQYYVRITKILREYIENGMKIPALENTTQEIIRSLKKKLKEEALLVQLNADLQLADLVKFAKAAPSKEDHFRILQTSRAFIEKTKPVISVPAQPEELPT